MLLADSGLVAVLMVVFEPKSLYVVWRAIALAEIPYASALSYTKELIAYIEAHLATPRVFSLTGRETDLLPCYNAMLMETFTKWKRWDSEAVSTGVA